MQSPPDASPVCLSFSNQLPMCSHILVNLIMPRPSILIMDCTPQLMVTRGRLYSTSNLFSALFLIFFNLFPTLFPCYFLKKISINLSFSKFPLFPLQFCKFSFKFHILDFNFLFSCFSCYISLNTLSLIFMLNRNLKCLLWYVAFL